MRSRVCRCCGKPSQSVHSNLCAPCEANEEWFNDSDDYDPAEEARNDYSLQRDDEDLRQRGVL